MRIDDISRTLLGLQPEIVEDVIADWEPVRALGDRGVRMCEQDVQYHLENLATAVALGTPSLFSAYATWAKDVLVSRAVPAECLRISLEAMRRRVAGSALPEASRDQALEALDLAARATAGGAQDAPTARTVPDGFRLSVEGSRQGLLDLVARWREEGGVAYALRQVARVQNEVGEAWLRNEISVAQEHRATALAQLALSLLAPHTAGAPGPRPRGRAVICCAEGDWHAVGPRIAADLLELEGYEVEFLGANTPVSELLKSCRDVRPALVGIGCAPLAALPAARAAAEAVRREFPTTRVILGGRAARIAGPEPLGADRVVGQDFDGRVEP